MGFVSQYFGEILSAITMLAVAFIGYKEEKQRKENKRYREHREEIEKRAAEEKFLSMQLQSANLKLAYVTSLAVTGGKINGNVEEAQKSAREAERKYYDFINKEYAEETTRLE